MSLWTSDKEKRKYMVNRQWCIAWYLSGGWFCMG